MVSVYLLTHCQTLCVELLVCLGILERRCHRQMLRCLLLNHLTVLDEFPKVLEAEHGKVCSQPCVKVYPSCVILLSAATECRTFLLYYLPILHGLLPDKYLAHALVLSKAIRILLSDHITPMDLEGAESLLLLFWRLTETFYG